MFRAVVAADSVSVMAAASALLSANLIRQPESSGHPEDVDRRVQQQLINYLIDRGEIGREPDSFFHQLQSCQVGIGVEGARSAAHRDASSAPDSATSVTTFGLITFAMIGLISLALRSSSATDRHCLSVIGGS